MKVAVSDSKIREEKYLGKMWLTPLIIYVWVFQDRSDKCVSVGLLLLFLQIGWSVSNPCFATDAIDHDQ